MDIDFSLPTEKVIRSLERIMEWRGLQVGSMLIIFSGLLAIEKNC